MGINKNTEIRRMYKMEDKMKKQNVQRLDISDNAINLLNDNKISTLGQLCRKSKADLKSLGLLQDEANKVEVELERIGLNLKNSF